MISLTSGTRCTRILPRLALVGRHQTPAAVTNAAARVHDAVLVRVERRGMVCEATAILEGNLKMERQIENEILKLVQGVPCARGPGIG